MDEHPRPENPTIIIIFGATGDLTYKKLIPSLMDLYVRGYLPQQLKIVGYSRRDIGDEGFKDIAVKSISNKDHSHSKEQIDTFLNYLEYQQGEFTNENDYKNLSVKLKELDKGWNICSNKLFYLAVPPQFYSPILDNLAKPGLYISCVGENEGWTKILVEKPFGKDLESAIALDKKLCNLFNEDQIYRIDHYLQKEVIQNILVFRFSNSMFEPIWNNQHIEKVVIKLHEEIGIEGRGLFYDDIGALRDVGQNHILQMIAAVAMEDPGKNTGDNLRDSRAKLLSEINTPEETEVEERLVRGQYIGFKEEDGVDDNSETETYFKLDTYIDNDRWRGVPFIMESGKRLPERVAEIQVYFRESSSCYCPRGQDYTEGNLLTFRIQPNEGISICFWVKRPDFQLGLTQKKLSFEYSEEEDTKNLPDAYEELLYDCIVGNQTLFIRSDEGEAAWKYISSVIDNWKNTELIEYKPGDIPVNSD